MTVTERVAPREQPSPDAVPALVEFRDVAVGFGDLPNVLEGVSFDVLEGEFVSLLGPSGCGKSTCLNVTAGLLKPRAGEVRFNGKPIGRVNTAVGYMTQDDTLLPWKNVYDNIALPLKIRKVAKAEIRERVDRYLDLMQVAPAAKKYPAQLSGGMKRRVLLARAMIYDPQILLMDEPFAALDAQMRAELHEELRRTCLALGQTVLFVTHDIAESALLSDRVLVVGGGPPSTVVAQHTIAFGRDRDLEAIRFEDRFRSTQQELHDSLSASQLAGSGRKGGAAA
jgi:NitT/TauT family transport system ATP-binding protein